MQRKRSVGKTVALGCGGLILLLIVLAFAGCGILRAVGGARSKTALARLRASGAPTTWEEVIPPPVPDVQNAALLYEEAYWALRASKAFETASRKALSGYLSATSHEERKALDGQLAAFVADTGKALSCTRDAARRAKCRFDRDYSIPYMVESATAWLRNLSAVASGQSIFLADHGDMAGALEAWSLNLSMVNHLESDPMLRTQLDRYEIIETAVQSLGEIVETGRPTVEECRRMAQQLARVELDQAFVSAVHAVRVERLWILSRAREDPRFFAEMTGGAGWTSKPASTGDPPISASLLWVAYRGISAYDQSVMLRRWEKQVAVAAKPYRESAGHFDAPSRGIRPTSPLSLFLVPFPYPLDQIVGARDAAKANLALMRTGLGLAAYRTRFGKYPQSLDELRRALDWQVPKDPFSGKDFVYSREGNGYVLYSLGTDLNNDGGAPLARDQAAPTGIGGDIVWRMER